jgi:hypothetical protein
MANEFNGWEAQDILMTLGGKLSGGRPKCVKTGLQLVKDPAGNVYVSTAGADVGGVAKQFARTATLTEESLLARGDMGWLNPQPILIEDCQMGSPTYNDTWRGLHRLDIA